MRNPACCGRSVVEILEPRRLLSSVFPNINISQLAGNQAEGSITVDRADLSKMFAVSNIDAGDGLVAATSSDGGATWSQRLIATDTDGLPPACCDCSAAFDSFGNLFVSYLNSKDNQIELLLSTDAGHSFSLLQQYSGSVDQPTVVTGPGSVWLEFDRGPGVGVAGALVTGLGAVGSFAPLQEVRGSGFGQFGDIAVNSAGQVMVTYQKDVGPHQSVVFVNFDSTGVGGMFGAPIRVTSTYVPAFDFIPAQNSRGIDSETGIAFDQSGGQFNGRLYLIYTNQIPANTDNTDIYIRYSDNNGTTWSAPIRVNDDTGTNSQFLPRISVDNTSGQVAVSWYDARNDLGTGGTGDTDQMTNDDVQFYAAVITPAADGLFVSPNQQISAGTSNSFDANSTIDLGDYSGLDFYNGTLHPLWFDNSNSTADNPNGKLNQLNVYTANASASTFSQGSEIALGGLVASSGPVASLTTGAGLNVGYIRVGSFYTITVSYSVGTDATTLSSGNLLVTGPNAFSQPAKLVRIRAVRNRPIVATFRVSNPTGNWAPADVGTYTILLQPNSVADTTGAQATGGILGNFVVATGLTAGSHVGGTGPKHYHRLAGRAHS
jgi:hypothetical protein